MHVLLLALLSKARVCKLSKVSHLGLGQALLSKVSRSAKLYLKLSESARHATEPSDTET